VTEAKTRLKEIEESALAVARNARELLISEGLDEDEGRHNKRALVFHLLETRGQLRLSELAKLTGRSLKAVNQSVVLLLEKGRIRRVKRGVYEAVPRGERLPKAQLSPPKPRKKRVRKRRPKSTLEKLGEM